MYGLRVFGAAAISNVGGRTRFSAIVAPNAPEFLKSIRGQTIGRRKIDNGKAQFCVIIGASVLKNLRNVSPAKMSTSRSISIACCLEEAVTNWESGRFTVADLEWALGKLARIFPYHWWRHLRRIFAAELCALEAAFRC